LTGQTRLGEGDLRRAERSFQQSLTISQGIDDPLGVAQQLNNLGAAALERGEFAQASEHFTRAREINQEYQAWAAASINLGNLATLAQKQGQLPQAARLLEEALDAADRANSPEARSRLLCQMAGLALDQNDLALAHNFLVKAKPQARHPHLQGSWNYQMGRLLQAQGDLEGARQHFLSALAFDRQVLDRSALAADLVALAEVAHAQGDLSAAFSYYERAFGVYDALRKSSLLPLYLERLRQLNAQGALGRNLAPFEARLPGRSTP
jgi:tetratricopeptide (TPR) repeat protein